MQTCSGLCGQVPVAAAVIAVLWQNFFYKFRGSTNLDHGTPNLFSAFLPPPIISKNYEELPCMTSGIVTDFF
jgi:hypothetical protein